jgi:aryl-phospho-beta-D-glucosidase BglC (GH1 family)
MRPSCIFLSVVSICTATAVSCSSPEAPVSQGTRDAAPDTAPRPDAQAPGEPETGGDDSNVAMPDAGIEAPTGSPDDAAADAGSDRPPPPPDAQPPDAGDGLLVSACSGVDPFLRTNGLTIRTGRGSGPVVALRGVNLGGWLMIEPYMTPVGDVQDDFTMHDTLTKRFGATAADGLVATYQKAWMETADFDRIAELGMNAVRIPITYFNVQNPDGTLRADAFDRLDWAVTEAWKRCIYVVFDLHGAWGSAAGWASSSKVGPSELWTVEENKKRSQALWEAIAAHYRGQPGVAGYDLINEPNGASSDQERWALQDRFYKAIRTIDADHMIFIEAIWWLVNLPQPSQFGWTNVVYECHHYDWDHQTDVAAQKAGADAKVTDFTSHASYGVPFYLGEFNFFGLPDAWKYGIEQWDHAGISWTTWSYRASTDGASLTNSWGVYNVVDPRPAKPSITNDSSADIQTKWSRFTAQAFGVNPMLKATLAMPASAADAYDVVSGRAFDVAAPGVLGNDHHVNTGQPGIALRAEITAPAMHGQVVLRADGSFTYTPESSFEGTDMFLYTAFDGRLHAPNPRPVTLRVRKTP